MNYKTPGVYVEELAKFPPSVAQVETAIPAFIGYTEKGPKNEPTRISSLLEYENLFGKAKNEGKEIKISVKDNTVSTTFEDSKLGKFKMYHAMQMYFANGGGPCYIVSVGVASGYPTEVLKSELETGLKTLEKEDEPTLIVFPDAESLPTLEAYGLYGLALDHAEEMKDRFVIMDVLGDDLTFRNKVVSTGLKYGAAYYPKLETVLTHSFEDEDVKITSFEEKDISGNVLSLPDGYVNNLKWLKSNRTELYNKAKAAIESEKVVMAPSSAVAGVYAKVDSTSGVFKAPANVGLSYVVAPTVKVSHEDQMTLNVDPTSGKSINVIRSFTGKGTLV
ncbi:phage tail sheath family protein, partial [Chryseobacterium mucoviscidosis]